MGGAGVVASDRAAWAEAAWGERPGGAGNAGPRWSGPLEVTITRSEGQLFRERVGFVFLAIIGAYSAMKMLFELKSILEPFLWALFLVMAWKPVVDGLEHRIERLLKVSWNLLRAEGGLPRLSGVLSAAAAGSNGAGSDGDDSDNEMQCMLREHHEVGPAKVGNEIMPEEQLVERGPRGGTGRSAAARATCQDVDGEDEDPRSEESKAALRRSIARSFAVLIATAGMLGLLCGFGMLILESARHMRDHWDVYQKGAEKLTRETRVFFQKVPESFVKQYQDASADMVKTAQDFLYGLLGEFVNNVSSVLLGFLLTLLYTLFWLCCPVPMPSSIDVMFRKYILFKTLACFGYGICVGVLLALLSIDLASVFALTTFALNYVPEVGPFVAMVLPCPVILLDSRLDRPLLVLLIAVLGQLALKFAFSNIIEVKLIESDKKLRMHPVMILLSVGIFGYLWGPTGMLLSVPLMALMKIALFSELVPASYRDPILVILEGDRNAPFKHGLKPSGSGSHRSGGLSNAASSQAAPGG